MLFLIYSHPTAQLSRPHILRFHSETAKSPRAESKPNMFPLCWSSQMWSCRLKARQMNCCCRVAATATSRSRLCWLRNNTYFPFASLRGNMALFLRSWLSAATKFSLTNRLIFRENPQFYTKIVVVGSCDRTTSEESWPHQKTQTGFTDTPGLTLTP